MEWVKQNAKKRNIEFLITTEYAWQIYMSQDRKCILSGVPLTIKQSIHDLNKTTASLDRIDSSIAYIEGNIQWTHKTVNIMKQNTSEAVFLEWCKKVRDFHENG